MKPTRFAASLIASLALVVPVVSTPSLAAPAQVAPAASAAVKPAPGKALIKLSTDKEGSHYTQSGVKVTAKITERGRPAKGKATFTVGSSAVKVKLKKGKATYQLDSTLTPANYKVTVKFGKAKKAITVPVWNSSLHPNQVAFSYTISLTYNNPAQPLTGQVLFKGVPATEGYVDLYRNGNNAGGNDSPDYIAMSSVDSAGNFKFSDYWVDKVATMFGVGTHQIKAFYTPTASFGEYIYSDWITVTVNP